MSDKYKKNHDTFNEFIFEKYFHGGSLREEISRLEYAAKNFIGKAKIANEAETLVHLNNLLNRMSPSEQGDEFGTILGEIQNKYDIVHDDLLIIASFENYAKAKLLSKGYVVHKISKPKKLQSLQFKKPIHRNTIRSRIYYDQIFIQHNTIGISQLLEEPYFEKLELSQIIYDSMKKCQSIRNSIHFGGQRITSWGTPFFQGILDFKKSTSN